MAYDSDRHKILLFGGSNATQYFQDTWEWDGATSTWTRVAVTGPSARQAAAMAYDRANHRMILFGGGSVPGTTFGDTWVWNPNPSPPQTPQWTLLVDQSLDPSIRCFGAAMTFDEDSGQIVRFGGWSGSVDFNTTYALTGSTWAARGEITGPPSARHWSGMCYDSEHQKVVLFGGNNSSGFQSDTWQLTWNGTTYAWARVGLSGGPAGRDGILAYDSLRGMATLFAGEATYPTQTYRSDTWEWDGIGWSQRAAAGGTVSFPTARGFVSLAYDESQHGVLLFGGTDGANFLNETWEWKDTHSTCGSADFNGDGDVGTDQDIEAFFRVLAGGHC